MRRIERIVEVKIKKKNGPLIFFSKYSKCLKGEIMSDNQNHYLFKKDDASNSINTIHHADISSDSSSEESDPVNHPAHYTNGEIECIDAIKSSMDILAFRGYLKGNVIKYMWRYEYKNKIEDLKKAQWYLDRLIESY